MKKLILLIALSFGLFLTTLPALAAEFSGQEGDVYISESKTDLHAAGNNVTLNANLLGDLIVAGGTVTVNNSVADSVMIAGGMVTIRGEIGKHIRVIGGEVLISGLVRGDVFVAGGRVTLTKEAVVEGSLYAGAGELTVAGTVKGEARVAAGKFVLSGQVSSIYGEVDQLKLTETAVVNGSITYKSTNLLTQASGSKVSGQITYTEVKHNPFAFLTIQALLWLIGVILLALIIVRLLPKLAKAVDKEMSQNFLNSLGLGLVVMIVTPVVCLFLLFSVIGLPIALLAIIAWLVLVCLASIFSSVVLGRWALNKFSKNTFTVTNWQVIVTGVVLIAIVKLVPFIGVIAACILLVAGIGALTATLRHSIAEQS